MNPENRKLLPRIAFTSFSARFREPTLKEGFDDIIKIDFKVKPVMKSFEAVSYPPFYTDLSSYANNPGF